MWFLGLAWWVVLHRGFCEEAVRFFQQLVQSGEVEPHEAIIVNLLSACSLIGTLSSGQHVHFYISTRRDLMVNGNVGSDSINTYVGCGNLGMAISVFEALEFNDIISWSTIISGMAVKGHGMHVAALFPYASQWDFS